MNKIALHSLAFQSRVHYVGQAIDSINIMSLALVVLKNLYSKTNFTNACASAELVDFPYSCNCQVVKSHLKIIFLFGTYSCVLSADGCL